MEANAQSDYYSVISGLSTSPNGRAPQGAARYNRSVWIITPAEMTAAGITTGSIVNSLGFNLSIAQNIATTGNFIVYLQNTADVTNTKSTTWATAITGMTTASNSPLTIPAAVGTFDQPFSGGTVFTYTGGGLYIAFEYSNPSGTLATTSNTALCNTQLTNGIKSAFSSTVAPTTVAVSNYRPLTRLGIEVLCPRPDALAVTSSALMSADLTWDSAGLAEIEYGPYNFVQGTGTILSGLVSPYTLNGLAESTAYDYYARSDCDLGNFSSWNGPLSFSTVFQPAIPTYNTSFEAKNFPLIGWKADTETNGSNWYPYFSNTSSALIQNGMYSAISVSNPTAVAAARMYSRGIALQAGSVATISYYVRNYVFTSTATASYQLTVGTAQTAAAQTTVVATETGISSPTFILKSFTFTPLTTGTYYFGFLHNSPVNATGTHAFIIDNLTVSELLAATQFDDSAFSLFPNPATNVINIESKNYAITKVSLTDLNGRIVKQSVVDNLSNFKINISDLSSGVYMMNITSKEGSVIKKVIKN